MKSILILINCYYNYDLIDRTIKSIESNSLFNNGFFISFYPLLGIFFTL